MRRQASPSISAIGPTAPRIPALFTTQSRRPKCSTAASTAAATSSSTETSTWHERRRVAEQRRRFPPGVVLDVDEHAAGALLDEPLGDGGADAARRAGDDGDLAVQSLPHGSSSFGHAGACRLADDHALEVGEADLVARCAARTKLSAQSWSNSNELPASSTICVGWVTSQTSPSTWRSPR